MPYSCFVISPIGKEGSEIRQHADDFYEMIVHTALQKYNFDTKRADKIASTSSITSEIITLIQEADLCIVDVTGTNPNVMYECGRRHETGKPTIMMAKKDEKLPFDINVMRTIFFELDTPRNVHNSVLTLQTFVDKIIQDGFKLSGSGDSLSSMMKVLNRIERKMSTINVHNSSLLTIGSQDDPVATGKLDVREAFALAIRQNELGYAESLLQRIRNIVEDDWFFDNFVEPLASLGSNIASEMLINERINILDEMKDDKRRQDTIGALVSYFNRRDDEARGLEVVGPVLDKILNNNTIDSKYRAFMLNQKSRLLYGLGKYHQCVELMEEAIRLRPHYPYYYNLAGALYKNDELGRAAEAITICLDLEVQEDRELDADHIELAIEVYKRSGNKEKSEYWLNQLQTISPYKYQLLRMTDRA